MLSKSQAVGKIGLESLMSRANIIFTNGYKFSGNLNIDYLQKSFLDITDRIVKFKHRIHYKSQNDFHWEKTKSHKNRFLSIRSNDIENEFKNICSRSFELYKESNYHPMLLVVIEQDNAEKNPENNFVIAQLSEHSFFDAGSSEQIFNKIIEYYNALENNDRQAAEKILAQTSQLITINSEDMFQLLQKEQFNHQANVEKLLQYPVADVGEYRLPPDTIDHHLEQYKKSIRKPIIQYFNISSQVQHCRSIYPDISRNSITCALLVKGFYLLNIELKNKSKEHPVSFKMLSNILPMELREQYSGNYISFMPVTVDGHLNIEDIAKAIDEWVKEFKSTQLNLSIFNMVEEAVKEAQVGTVDEEISFVVTNWNNYTFLKKTDYLSGCQSLKHFSGVNIEPKDSLGALLVNRPVLVINLSPDEELCLSFFPSLRSENENLQIAQAMEKSFAPI